MENNQGKYYILALFRNAMPHNFETALGNAREFLNNCVDLSSNDFQQFKHLAGDVVQKFNSWSCKIDEKTVSTAMSKGLRSRVSNILYEEINSKDSLTKDEALRSLNRIAEEIANAVPKFEKKLNSGN